MSELQPKRTSLNLELVPTVVDGHSTSQIVEKPEESAETHDVPQKVPKKKKRIIRMVKGAAGMKSKVVNPLLSPENGLTIVERYFHHMPETSPQIILTYIGRIAVPKGSRHLSVQRIVDVHKLTAADIYRTACTLDYELHTFKPMGTVAADIRVTHKFTPLESEDTIVKVAKEELNQKFHVTDSNSPLWSVHIVAPESIDGDGITLGEKDVQDGVELPKFFIVFSFHHCICDGLSGWAYIRKFLTKVVPENFQVDPPNLEGYLITKTPPPILDNYINPFFIELLPAFFEFIGQQIMKQTQKKHLLKTFEPVSVSGQTGIESPVLPYRPLSNTTNVRFFKFDEDFSEALRDKCRKHGTTIAAAVIVAALIGIRNAFALRAKKKEKPLPSHQSWVVTSSTRPLLPNSRLLEGADKEKDPSLMEFGGYGSSISHEHFKFNEKSDLWNRCKAVKRHLSSSFLKSMRRLKLMNWFHRKPKLSQKIQAKVDLEEMTRTYSVEVANLGAWSTPFAPMDTIRNDLPSVDWFAGTLNNSFLGARAFFTIALISINNVMSFSMAYDMGAVTEEEAILFQEGMTRALTEMKDTNGGITVKSLDS